MTVQDARAAVDRIMVGSWALGEIPAPFRYRFVDDDGSGINLTGWTAKMQWTHAGAVTSRVAGVLPDQDTADGAGWVEYAWQAGDFAAAGLYDGNFWVDDGASAVLASVDLGWKIRTPATPATAIPVGSDEYGGY